ncbi:MAG: type II toxin-antitoxin system HicA family toxin [Pseudomonadota bacterium]
MKTISGNKLCGILEKKGWLLKRVHGSHHIYAKAGLNLRISVPVHGNKSLKCGLQKSLMKSAGIDEKDL